MSEFLVIGLSSLGRTLALELVRLGAEVTVADHTAERIDRIKNRVEAALTLDSTDRHAIETLDVARFDHVIVCMAQQFEVAERTTLALLDCGARAVTNVATTSQRGEILRIIGAQRVLTPGLLQARNLAVELTEPTIASFWFVSEEQGMAAVPVPGPVELSAADLPGFFGPKVRYVAVARRTEEADETPAYEPGGADGVNLLAGDSLLVFGRPTDIAQFVKKTLS